MSNITQFKFYEKNVFEKMTVIEVFFRSDFKDIADYDQVGRGLRNLVRDGLLMKIGYNSDTISLF